MTLVAGVSASIQEAKITGNASGPLRLNMKSCTRGGSRNHAATINAPFVTRTVGISHGGRATRRYSFARTWRRPGTASMSTSWPSRSHDFDDTPFLSPGNGSDAAGADTVDV
jgi:hypothetical protein